MSKKGIKIAIDGPAGAGKSTVAKAVAAKLDYMYIDSGALYRAITLKALRKNVPFEDRNAMKNIAEKAKIDLRNDQDRLHIFLDNEDVTEEIRSLMVNNRVSQVAKMGEIRKVIVDILRDITSDMGVVMDGRDIGSFVLPDAEAKFYLTASEECRAKRRYAEFQSKGHTLSLEDTIKEIADRDETDRKRELAPLVKAEDAILVDSTSMSLEQVISAVLQQSLDIIDKRKAR